MPRIPEYLPKADIAGPTGGPQASGADFGANVGAEISKAGAETVQLGSELRRRQKVVRDLDTISKIHADISALHGDTTVAWSDLSGKADPYDKTAPQNFLKDYAAKLDKIGEQADSPEARRFFQEKRAEQYTHFQELTNATEVHLAGERSVENAKTLMAGASSGLLYNPSNYQAAEKDLKEYVGRIVDSGNLNRVKAEELLDNGKKAYATAAIQGWIKLSPDEARDQLNSGEWDDKLDGKTKRMLYLQADEQERSNKVKQHELDEALKKEKQAKRDAANDGYAKDFYQGKPIMDRVMNDPALADDFKSKEYWRKVVERKDEHKNDEPARAEIVRRIMLPDGDPDKITKSMDIIKLAPELGLNTNSIGPMMTRLMGSDTPEYKQAAAKFKTFEDEWKQKIAQPSKIDGTVSPSAADRWSKAHIAMQDAFYQAMQKHDYTSIFDPRNPNYLGKAAGRYQQGFVKTINETIDYWTKQPFDQIGKPNAAPTPAPTSAPVKRLPNESTAAFLKRTGGK